MNPYLATPGLKGQALIEGLPKENANYPDCLLSCLILPSPPPQHPGFLLLQLYSPLPFPAGMVLLTPPCPLPGHGL